MFRKILIANRGEIALRIIWACRELGIHTVAIYSEADADSLHVKFADEEVCIGPPANDLSYLNLSAVISAAEITGAEAVHPGYGYLAESAHFAEVGSVIKKGQVICIVEAMKVMNEIESEIDAEVAQILVANGQPVEFGESLFKLRPLS